MRSNSSRRLLFAIEKLQHRDAVDVLLKIGVDSGDGHADAPVALLHAAAELDGDQNHQRHHRQQQAGHAGAELQHGHHHERQHQQIAQNHQQAGREQFVECVDIGSDARDHASHRIAIVVRDIQPLQVRHQLAAKIEHGFLADPLHEVLLAEIAHQGGDDGE